MKKNVNMSIAGQIFHIDEDAYNLLENYLRSLQMHFGKSEADKELMGDFENRIAELLLEMNSSGNRVVDIELVRKVIERIGKPEEIFGDEASNGQQQRPTAAWETSFETSKKYYRSLEDAWLGGVLSGLAAYTGWSLGLLRLLAVLISVFGFFWLSIIAYIICWMVVPAARTAGQKLEMRGETITVENIGREVTDRSQYASYPTSSSTDRVGGCLLRGCLGSLLLVVLFPIIIIMIAVVGGSLDLAGALWEPDEWRILFPAHHSWMFVASVIAGVITILVPVVALVRSMITTNNPAAQPLPKWLNVVGITLWIISIIALIVFFAISMPQLLHDATVHGVYYGI